MRKFSVLLSDTMNNTMVQVFGESASELIYTLMERQAALKREEVGEKIEAFHAYVKKLVGSEIAQVILTAGLKGLCAELRREYEEVEKYLSFLEDLYEIKLRLLALPQREEKSVGD